MVQKSVTYAWAQNKPDLLFITIRVADLNKESCEICVRPDGFFSFSAQAPQAPDVTYTLQLRLFDRIRVEDSQWDFRGQYVRFKLRKDKAESWPSLQRPGIPKPASERIDFDLWQNSDSDSDDEVPDFSNFTTFAANQKKMKSGEGFLDFIDLFVLAVILIPVFATPFTKVEESFNLQATHDFIYHNVNLSEYDHFQFPGVVKRSALGAFFLALATSPVALLVSLVGGQKLVCQYAARIILGVVFWGCLTLLRKEVHRRWDLTTSVCFGLVTVSQFHFLFYSTRTLPNTFAVCLVMLAYVEWFRERYAAMVALLEFACIVFRCEVAVLEAAIVLPLVLRRRIGLGEAVWWGIGGAVLALAATVSFDSVFWGELTWTEGEAFHFNAILGKSAQWGILPFHWYFSHALPKALLGAIPLAVVGLAVDARRLWMYVVPMVAFVFIYSFLGHKELRFVFYVIPIINIAAAVGLAYCYKRSAEGRRLGRACLALAAAVVMTGMALSAAFLMVSTTNYPGGAALQRLHAFHGGANADASPVAVHVDVAAAQTGVSRFGERGAPWTYSKNESLSADADFAPFSYLVTERPEVQGFHQVLAQQGFAGVGFDREKSLKEMLKIRLEDKIFVLRNNELRGVEEPRSTATSKEEL